MNRSNSIEDTVKLTAEAILKGVALPLVKRVLLNDGFKPQQADTMIRWAQQHLVKRKEAAKAFASSIWK